MVRYVVVTVLVIVLAPPAVAVEDTPKLSLALGYAIGIANTPFKAETPLDASDNDPLVALRAEVPAMKGGLGLDVMLGLANFGRIVSFIQPAATLATSDTIDAAEVRQSMLADLVVRYRPFSSQMAVAVNAGFVFDAEGDAASVRVPDASSYLFLGPSYRHRFGTAGVRIDALVGQSEIMTNKELFSSSFDSKLLRVRPRLEFHIPDVVKSAPLCVGFWGDLGFHEDVADTYAVFITTTMWGSKE